MTDYLAAIVKSPPEPRQRRRKQPADATPKKQPPYAVVVFNNEVHTFEYVIETFTKVFGYRTLLCLEKGLPLDSNIVKTFLVAHEVPTSTCDFCQNYGVSVVQLPRQIC